MLIPKFCKAAQALLPNGKTIAASPMSAKAAQPFEDIASGTLPG